MNDELRGNDPRPRTPSDLAALDRSLAQAAASLESARKVLALRRTVGRSLRVAIRCLLEAQDKIETEGPSTAARLDLLEAIRLIGTVEQEIKASLPGQEGGGGVPDDRGGSRRPVERGGGSADRGSGSVDRASSAATRAQPLDARHNRRAFQRLPAHFQIQLEPAHRTQRQDAGALPLNGMTVNLSRGGMLANVEQGILRHGRYLIRFLEASGAIQPEVTWGAVRRSRARDKGWEVGIEFDDPLEEIK